MQTHWYGPQWVRVICSYHSCSSTLDSSRDDGGKTGDTEQRTERGVLRARTPACSPRGEKTGGAPSPVTTSTSAKDTVKKRNVLFEGVNVSLVVKLCTSAHP